MKQIAIVLSGCGFKDGTEITEAISSFISITAHGCSYKVFAPSLEIESVNHINGQSTGKRQLMAEASRISRGEIEDLNKLNPKSFDALLFPGGFGAALHLCDWATKGASCEVLPDVKRCIESFYNDSKPIGAICIAPVIIAKVLGKHGVSVTIGNDKETANEIEKTGAEHIECPVSDFITDRGSKIITTPAYMYDAKACDVFKGIDGLIAELSEMA